jgi:hypothetical protein
MPTRGPTVKLSLPDPPLKAFLARVKGKPGARLQVEADFPVTGFYRVLGITALDEADLPALARTELARDGSTLVQIVALRTPDFDGRDSEIADLVEDPRAPGVWYRSGHAYFGDEDNRAEE